MLVRTSTHVNKFSTVWRPCTAESACYYTGCQRNRRDTVKLSKSGSTVLTPSTSQFLANGSSPDIFVNVTVSTHTKTQKWRRKLVQRLLLLQVCVWGVSINCGPSIMHSFRENKTTKFLLKSLQAFLQNFAVSKLSCYTVIKTLVSTSCWLTSLRDQLLICKGTGKVKDCFVRERIAKGLRGRVQEKLNWEEENE